jgi:hypothetical protein
VKQPRRIGETLAAVFRRDASVAGIVHAFKHRLVHHIRCIRNTSVVHTPVCTLLTSCTNAAPVWTRSNTVEQYGRAPVQSGHLDSWPDVHLTADEPTGRYRLDPACINTTDCGPP